MRKVGSLTLVILVHPYENRCSGYNATTDDVLLGLKVSVDKKLISRRANLYSRTQNFVVQMRRGINLNQALKNTGLDYQSMRRLAWRGAAWRTYKIVIK